MAATMTIMVALLALPECLAHLVPKFDGTDPEKRHRVQVATEGAVKLAAICTAFVIEAFDDVDGLRTVLYALSANTDLDSVFVCCSLPAKVAEAFVRVAEGAVKRVHVEFGCASDACKAVCMELIPGISFVDLIDLNLMGVNLDVGDMGKVASCVQQLKGLRKFSLSGKFVTPPAAIVAFSFRW